MKTNLINHAIESTIAAGLTVKADCFIGAVPSPAEKFVLEAGDLVSIPMDLVPMRECIDGRNSAVFAFVEVEDFNHEVSVFRLFPSVFFRSAIDLDGRRHTIHGNVNDTVKWCHSYQEVMHLLRGKRLRVTDVRCVETREPRTGEVRIRRIYDFDFA